MNNQINLKDIKKKLFIALIMDYPVELKINGEYYEVKNE